MKLLLTGATGFTGQHFIAAARELGHEVFVLRAKLEDAEALRYEVAQRQPEAVLHLAGISFVAHQDVSAFYHVHVVGSLNLLAALATLVKPPRSVLLASSSNVYGNCEQSPITEQQPPAPISHYATSKLAMEYMARTYLDRLPLFFVRPFNYTGVGQSDVFVIPKLVAHFARRAACVELGNLAVEREFNDVRFVCDVYLSLLEKAVPGEIYNVCSNHPVTLKAVIAQLAAITGHHLDVRVNPAFVRANEIQRLCGSTDKLVATIGSVAMPTLSETLGWMLESAGA